MANCVKDLNSYNTKVFKISGPLGQRKTLKSGEGKIEVGQILSYDETTGKLKKYVKGTTEAFTIALGESDSTSADSVVLVAIPVTVFNTKEVKGTNLTTDFKAIKELWTNGIILEEVE